MARSFFVPCLFVGLSITRILIDYFLFLYSIHDIHRQEGREQQFSAAACHYTCTYSVDHFFYSRLNRDSHI